MPLRSSFSVEYEYPDHPDNYCAADWNHWEKNRWIRSWKSMTGSQWYREDDNGGRLNQLVYRAILEKFGLWAWAHELPEERVESMSPAKLMEYRKTKGLPHQEVKSDTPGDHRPAEEFN